MGNELFIDRSYTTSLGTAFYDRVQELRHLDTLSRAFKTIVVYGPRNVGKSELVRYWLSRKGFDTIVVDARFIRSRELFEKMGVKIFRFESLRSIARDIMERVVDSWNVLSLAKIIGIVIDRVFEIIHALRKPLYILVDEYHLLPGYRDHMDALKDLEAMTSLLAKEPYFEDLRLVVTLSEGFISTAYAQQKLVGYSTTMLLVEPMDTKHFSKLYQEYCEHHGCTLRLEEFLGLVGTYPGYLKDLCESDEESLVSNIEHWLRNLDLALDKAMRSLGLESREHVIEGLLKAIEVGIEPSKDFPIYPLSEMLTESSIVYTTHTKGRIVLKPQLNLYYVAIKLAIEKNIYNLLNLDISMLLEYARKLGEELLRRAQEDA